MRTYDAAIFDLDGTLLDTAEGIYSSVGYVIKKLGLGDVSDEVMRSFIGPPMQTSFSRVFGMEKKDADAAADMFRNRYKESDLFLARPYDGIFETIEKLKHAGIRSAVATYKRQDYAEKILTHFGFDRVCEVMCGADFAGKLSKRDIIENAMKDLGVADRTRAVMIGDSDNDAIGAAQLGVPFIAVTYGFGFADEDAAGEFSNIGVAATPLDIVRIMT